jgi:hypothetical protein
VIVEGAAYERATRKRPYVELSIDRAAAPDHFIAIFKQLIADSELNQSRHLGYASACEK